MNIFDVFKENVIAVRKALEEFKDNHKMANKAISLVIDTMPEPFNKFASVIWDGLEKRGEADSSAKLLEILEKIENNTEQSFSEIKTNISELIQFGAKTEDIQKLGEQIRTSNESVIQNLKEAFNEELKKAAHRLEESSKKNQTELRLLESNLQIVSSIKEYGKGNLDCWKEAYFRDADIKNGYDARRPIIDNIIRCMKDNLGTIVYGKPYYGKSMILKRVMFEEMEENGYAVVYAKESVKANSNSLIELLNRFLHNYPRLLVIADDVHRSGGEVLFQAFNKFAEKEDQTHGNYSIRFLFGARKEELDIAKENITDWEIKQEISDALKKIPSFNINFENDDATLFLRQALFVTSSNQDQFSAGYIKEIAERLYQDYKGDPFMFIFAVRYYLLRGKIETFDFIETDIKKKIESFGKEEEIWKAALLCSFMGMFGIMPIQPSKPSLPPNKIIVSCSIDKDYLEYLRLSDVAFLFEEEGGYKIRHEHWALEFLIYLYSEKFNNYINELFKKQKYETKQLIKIKELIRDRVKQLIESILGNIEINGHLSILNRCSSLYNDYDRSKPICKLVDNYIVPDTLNDSEKAKVYCYGLGNFYNSIKDYPRSLQLYDKAIEIASNDAHALSNRGSDAWFNKGVVLDNLGKYEEAIRCFDKAIELSSVK